MDRRGTVAAVEKLSSDEAEQEVKLFVLVDFIALHSS
jgi:hypothetical protein